LLQETEKSKNTRIAARNKKLTLAHRKNISSTSSLHHRDHHSTENTEQKIHQIRIGDYLIDTWYNAPYPEEYSKRPILHICEFCLKYIKSEYIARRHKVRER
jgi:hypothetical protein